MTAGAFQPAGPEAPWSSNGGFLAKLNPAGSALIFSTYLTGGIYDLDLDAEGNAYVLGQASYGFPVTLGALQACMNGGESDILAAQFTPDGKLAGATYLGGSGNEMPAALAAATDGTVYITGTTMSSDFPGIVGAGAGRSLMFAARVRINDPQQPHGPCLSLGVQNGATFLGGPIAAGEIVTLRGNGFGPEEPAFQQIGPDGKVTTTLAGVQVFFNQNPAPLLYVQSQQINAVVPWETRGGSLPGTNPVLVRVVYNGVSTNTVQVGDASAAPGLFLRDFTSPQAAAMNEDGTMNGASNPAKRGSAIAIFGTGGGPTNPPGVTGGLWPGDPVAQLTLPVSVRIAGVGADVLYAGSAPRQVSGVFQINVRIPDSVQRSTAAPLDLTVGGVSILQNSRTIAIE